MYLKLIAEANDLDEPMAYVRENPWSIEQYADRLAGKFADGIDAIYRVRIRKAAKSATKRKEYQDVCAMPKRYRKSAASADQAGLIGELRKLYANRPAFMDELNALK